MKPLILVSAQDLDFYLLLKHILEADGFVSALVDLPEDVIRLARAEHPQAIVFDCVSAACTVAEICAALKGDPATGSIPLVALIGPDAQSQHIPLLKAGIDEGLNRPVNPGRLLDFLRKAVIEAPAPIAPPGPGVAPGLQPLIYGDIELNPETFLVRIGANEIHLGPIEFRLLHHLLKSPDKVFTRDELIGAAWSEAASVDQRTVDVHIGHLRRAMEAIDRTKMIRTVRSVGYALNPLDGAGIGEHRVRGA